MHALSLELSSGPMQMSKRSAQGSEAQFRFSAFAPSPGNSTFYRAKKLADTANQQQREVSRTVFESVRSDSGADAVCRATAEPKPKPERKAAESAESSAQTPQRSAETPKQHHRASAEAKTPTHEDGHRPATRHAR